MEKVSFINSWTSTNHIYPSESLEPTTKVQKHWKIKQLIFLIFVTLFKFLKKCLPTSRIKTGKPNRNINFIKFYLLYQKNTYTFASIRTASTFIPLSVSGNIFLVLPVSAGVA